MFKICLQGSKLNINFFFLLLGPCHKRLFILSTTFCSFVLFIFSFIYLWRAYCAVRIIPLTSCLLKQRSPPALPHLQIVKPFFHYSTVILSQLSFFLCLPPGKEKKTFCLRNGSFFKLSITESHLKCDSSLTSPELNNYLEATCYVGC